ncbi:hypothetical protein L249_1336 [Ophiocordyceps polyrhachis-furcata BCC 54312]|uniref:Uncharacterized protein n=1 Tax=Ophiocordyceps polyrhachis-furcata BCC 54312 TaxID=1330021 RepID=A0A367LCU5_9HYPO|nr:hypothetical protein L249_1336 [Ophiocordyceps polyrhachis-furcata BCC 54312]
MKKPILTTTTLAALTIAAAAATTSSSPPPPPSPIPTLPQHNPLSRRGDDDVTLSEQDFTTVPPTAPWVTIDDEGQPAMTVTPSIATVSGGTTTTVEHGAPHDLTASVFTWITWGAITTSTGTPPNPTALDAKTGQGAFSRCFNRDRDLAPFCRPLVNSTLLTGTAYYVTWDPDFYKTNDNTTLEIAIRIDYLNQTTNEWSKLDTYDRVPSKWGFWPLRLNTEHLKGQRYNNATITLVSSAKGSDESSKSAPLPVTFAALGVDDMPPPRVPKGSTLLIALPISLGSFFLVLIGLYLWHRKTRRIDLGNIMSRSRHGYSGRKQRRRRLLRSIRRQQEEDEPRVPLTDYHDRLSPIGHDEREKLPTTTYGQRL